LSTAQIVNAVHDEIVVECAASEAENIAILVREEMQAAGQTLLQRIPLKADVQITHVWDK
jgi:DNA polymerase-1